MSILPKYTYVYYVTCRSQKRLPDGGQWRELEFCVARTLPFSMTPHKAQLEDRSPRADVDEARATLCLKSSFHSEYSRKDSQHQERKTSSVPSRSHCGKEVGFTFHWGRKYDANQHAYIGTWCLEFSGRDACSICSSFLSSTQGTWKRSTKANKIPLISQFSLSQNLGMLPHIAFSLITVEKFLATHSNIDSTWDQFAPWLWARSGS